MVRIQEQSKAAEPPKPCDVFDLICGTSSGGIIALMLGHLRMSVQEVKDQYCVIAERVFGHTKKGFGKGRDRFSAEKPEEVMKETIAKYSGSTTSGEKETGDPEPKLI
jgi:patatin-like phospholipase/acyl hydrolase